jgi:hypothetical protein
MSSTGNMLAAACVGFGSDWKGSGGTVSVDRKRSLNMGGGTRQLAIGSHGSQDLKAIFL